MYLVDKRCNNYCERVTFVTRTEKAFFSFFNENDFWLVVTEFSW
jgi:hypothetical protein